MKYLNTILLLVIIAAIGAYFYHDHRQAAVLQARLDSLEAKAAPAKAEEPSPFDKMPSDPMHDSHAIHSGPVTTISFEKTVYDFGSIVSGPKYKTSFTFTNTGKDDLYISDAKASCGCTVPSYSTEPIKPGKSGTIDVEFDSQGRAGQQVKLISVKSNTVPSENILSLKSNPYLKK